MHVSKLCLYKLLVYNRFKKTMTYTKGTGTVKHEYVILYAAYHLTELYAKQVKVWSKAALQLLND